MASDSRINCQYCGIDETTLDNDGVVGWVECEGCGARGPRVLLSRPDYEAQVVAAWNAGRKLGRVGVAVVPKGLPTQTMRVAERVRLLAEGITLGEYGHADAAIMLLRANGHVRVLQYHIDDADTLRVLDAVRDSQRIRAGVAVPPSKAR